MNRRSLSESDLLQMIKNSPVASLNTHLIKSEGIKIKGKSKYNAIKTEVDGKVFDSIKEANRYKELKLLLKSGAIGFLELQVPYELNEGGSHSLKYVADFVYIDATTGKKIVEDCKGFKTDVYKKKKRLMLQVHGIVIYET